MKMYRPHRLCPRNSKPKEPSLYRSLCVSILCMFLSTVMLVGTTMAWFSDSLQTGMFTISSADFTVTTYYCSVLADEGSTNNWQRLNPGNTTMFGGGSLSSGSYQTAYLKIVNGSGIDLKYTLTITGGTEGETVSNPSLSLAYKVVTDEDALRTAFQDDMSAFTDAKDSFTVSTGQPTFVALKLSLGDTVYGTEYHAASASPDEKQAKQYPFGLRLTIMQAKADSTAQAADPVPPVTAVVETEINGGTPPTSVTMTPAAANDSNNVTSQPTGENNPGGNQTDTSSGSSTETEKATEPSESGTDTGDTGSNSGDDKSPAVDAPTT